MLSCLDRPIRALLGAITRLLPVKVIKDDNGVPFLYRYHLISFGKDGPGLCIHNFVKSDPDRGYHDHPWTRALAFILCGSYEERIYSQSDINYVTHHRNMWTFNYLDGCKTFHRVMVDEKKTVWTLFAFGKRSKTWGMIGLDNKYHAMSTQVEDNDAYWWNTVPKGARIHEHLPLSGNVIVTADSIVLMNDKVLLIKRGKAPFKDMWAFPGGRVEPSDADIKAACHRELKEETNLDDVKLEFYTYVDNATRDPRGFCVTFVFVGKVSGACKPRAGDDAVDYRWFDVNNLPEMAFDHKEILTQYMHHK
jgi:8-oxo-dGTP diphosphatase